MHLPVVSLSAYRRHHHRRSSSRRIPVGCCTIPSRQVSSRPLVSVRSHHCPRCTRALLCRRLQAVCARTRGRRRALFGDGFLSGSIALLTIGPFLFFVLPFPVCRYLVGQTHTAHSPHHLNLNLSKLSCTMNSCITPPSPSWAIHSYIGPQPDFIQAVDVDQAYPSLPSPPSDGASTPRTPPQPVLPMPKSPKRSSRKLPARSNTPPPPTKSAVANGPSALQSWAQPTISTFSASSSSFNHIHIVQPYLQGSAASSSGATDLFANSGIHFVGMDGPSSDGRPPRPANAWILYRSAKMKVLKEPQTSGQPRRTQADISKLIAEMWKNETPEVRQYYEAMSDMKKAEHLAQYPTYRFQPMKKADKEKARLEKKAQKERERAEAALTRSRGSRSRRRQAAGAPADDSQLDGQIAGFPPGTQVLAWGTTPSTPHSVAFQPYSKPAKRSSSKTRKPHTPSEQSQPLSSQPSVEKPDAKPPLAPLNTTSISPATVAPSALSGVAQLAAVDHLQFAQDWTQTPYSAHSDYSYPPVPPLMVRLKF